MMRLHHIVALAVLAGAAPALADDAPDELPVGWSRGAHWPWPDLRFTLDGYLRVRADVFDDLDLSRGPTPTTGQPIFPTPAGGGDSHLLTAVDMRVRLEPTLQVGQAVSIHMRVDVLDDIGFGTTPDVFASGSFALAATGTASPAAGVNSTTDAVRVKRAWGEVTLPFGTLAAGRMGALVSWGTGFFINNGNCMGCDYGDSGDRIALTVPLLGHFITALYELSASGPYVTPFAQAIPVEPQAHVDTWALAIARWKSDASAQKVLAAGRPLVEYGLLASYRSQGLDAPAWTQSPTRATWTPNDFVRRGMRAFASDLWLLVHTGGFRGELELATVLGQIDDATNMPGVSLRQPITSTQFGGVGSLAYTFGFPLRLRLEVGFASGDDAPGFGVRVAPGQLTTQKGDFDGPQLRPPVDTTVDNFRFHPDYHVDLILWRRIVGQVTDAIYIRPSLRLGPFGTETHHFSVEAALVDSHSIYATTPPGQDTNLGVELDLYARYHVEPAFELSLAWGLLLPGAGFRNVALGLDPSPAQALEIILAYRL